MSSSSIARCPRTWQLYYLDLGGSYIGNNVCENVLNCILKASTLYSICIHVFYFNWGKKKNKKNKNPSLKFLDSFYRCPKLAQERPWPSLLDVYYGNTLKVGLSELSIICQCFSVFQTFLLLKTY